jgi:hypothetical protein
MRSRWQGVAAACAGPAGPAPAPERRSAQAAVANRWWSWGLLVCVVPSVPALAANGGGAVALTSQLVDRGIAIAPVKPTLQGAGYWLPAPGWSASASASLQAPLLSKPVAFTGQLSRYWMVGERWQFQASVLYYGYPSDRITRTFNRREVSAGWSYRDVLNLSLSTFNFPSSGGGRWSSAADATLQLPLWRGLSASAGLGISQFPVMAYGAAQGGHYQYGQLGLKWSGAGWSVELDRLVNSSNTPQAQGSQAREPWLFMVSRSF